MIEQKAMLVKMKKQQFKKMKKKKTKKFFTHHAKKSMKGRQTVLEHESFDA